MQGCSRIRKIGRQQHNAQIWQLSRLADLFIGGQALGVHAGTDNECITCTPSTDLVKHPCIVQGASADLTANELGRPAWATLRRRAVSLIRASAAGRQTVVQPFFHPSRACSNTSRGCRAGKTACGLAEPTHSNGRPERRLFTTRSSEPLSDRAAGCRSFLPPGRTL